MGILDEAIKDHLDLKRRRGTDEPELKRLEDEAFGPPGRPDASGADAAIASALAAPAAKPVIGEPPSEGPPAGFEAAAPAAEVPAAEVPAPETPPPEAPPAPTPETAPEKTPADEPGASEQTAGGSAFHDFAAEEGLVEGRVADVEIGDEPASPGEKAVSEALAGGPAAPEQTPQPEPTEQAPSPGQEDTQVHDMAKELGLEDEVKPESGPADVSSPPGDAAASLDSIELDDLDLELELESEELDLDADEIEVEVSEPEGSEDDDEDEQDDDGEPDADDVLEETPEFLRDTPESDRLWFEQGKPKDFDFDEDDE